jgi:PAS domain S-box-containing protein
VCVHDVNDQLGGDSSDDPGTASATDHERLLNRVVSHAIFEVDTGGTITAWPGPARTLYGYEPDDALGRHITMLFTDEEEVEDTVADALDGSGDGPESLEHWHQRLDGTVFWATLTLSPLSDAGSAGFAVVSQDTTDAKQYERMLERQNDRLKEFTDILAHDLRTPLGVIEGHLELYRDTGDTEHLDVLAETTDRMERLVEDLLQVARQGNVVTDPVRTDLAAVAETAWEGVGREDATLHCEDVGAVSADADRLCELLENLFRNAVQHGGHGVTVRVGLLAGGFYVEDDGPGIPEDRRASVFDHGVTTSEDGSGYGLSIVRTIANAHGWDVVVAEGSDGGARFEVTGVEGFE